MKEYILCAAIYYNDGKKHTHTCKNLITGYVLCGWRHHNIINIAYELTKNKIVGIQGFLTSQNNFYGREKSAEIAFEAGQIKEKKQSLFSEDIY